MTTIPRSHQLNEIGTPITLTVYRKDGALEVDVDTAAVLVIVLSPQVGTPKKKTALPVGTNTGQMRYITINDDLDEIGTWFIQGYLEITGQGNWPTNIISIEVEDNLVSSFT